MIVDSFKKTFNSILHFKMISGDPHNFHWLLQHMSLLVYVNKQIYSESYSSELVSELTSSGSEQSLDDTRTF